MAKKAKASAEYEYHFVGTRLRVIGSGNLRLAFTDLDNTQMQQLAVLPMQATTRFEPTRLANFQSQRTRLVGTITELSEYFSIGRIIIYAKPVALEYPTDYPS